MSNFLNNFFEFSYKITLSNQKLIKFHGKNELTIINPCLWPDPVSFDESYEPVVLGTIVKSYMVFPIFIYIVKKLFKSKVCPTENERDVNQLCLVSYDLNQKLNF